MFARGARVTVRSHAGQESKAVVVCEVGQSVKDQGAYLVRTSSGRRVVSSAQMRHRASEGDVTRREK